MTVSITEADLFTVLGNFLVSILPTGMPVVRGQVNRVAEVEQSDFAVMWPIMLPRLATNIDSYLDCVFTASITGTTLNVTDVNSNFKGIIAVGSTIFGVGITPNTTVTAFGTGSGGIGSYTISQTQTINSEQMAAGTTTLIQKTEAVVQLDIHGPNSQDNTQIITTIFRDDIGVQFFAASGFDMAPLYSDDPRQMPFLNAESQYEDRWIVDLHIQINPAVILPQQFADALSLTLIDVDVTYPPT